MVGLEVDALAGSISRIPLAYSIQLIDDPKHGQKLWVYKVIQVIETGWKYLLRIIIFITFCKNIVTESGTPDSY